MSASTATSWIVVGAEVVVVYDTAGFHSAKLTTITSVAAKSFTVEAQDGRFTIEPVPHKTQGQYGAYDVYPADSEQGRIELHQERLKRLAGLVTTRYEEWRRDPLDDEMLGGLADAVQRLQKRKAAGPR